MTIAKNKIIWVLTLAFILKLVFIFPQFSGDIRNHQVWGNEFLNSPFGFYSRHFPGFNDANYPPLAIFFFAAFNFLFSSVNTLIQTLNSKIPLFPSFLVPLFASENMAMAFLKLPGVIFDVGAGYVIYLMIRRRNLKSALLIASLYLFNPATIYISSVWGQLEPVTIFFLLVSLYCAFYTPLKHKYLSLLLFTLGSLSKQTTLWFLPIYLFVWTKEMSLRVFLQGVLLSTLTFFFSYLPFGLLPFAAIQNYLLTLAGSSTIIADAAWNLWYLAFRSFTLEDSYRLGFFTIRQLSVTLLVFIIIWVYRQLYLHYQKDRVFISLFFWSLAVFFIQTRVHERHLAFSLPFLLLTPGITSRLFLDYVFLSAFHFANLYSSLKLPFI